MIPSNPKILVAGATGYVGGTVLSLLLSSPDASKYGQITCLVRAEEHKQVLINKFGNRVNPVVFAGLDDTEHLTEVASQHDIFIDMGNTFHLTSPRAFVLGLAKRKEQTGKDAWYIRTSGTSNMADRPITKKYVESIPNREFSDQDDIYGYEKMRHAEEPYPQRRAELSTIDAGLETGVKTIVIMSPLIYGIGTGEFNTETVQVQAYARYALKNGYAITIGDGAGE